MKILAYLRALWDVVLNRARMNRELEEEIRAHIEMHADDLERGGLSRVEAERSARIRFGGEARFKEECHEEAGGMFIDSLRSDARFALRLLRKSPGFTVVAVLAVAMGIAANAVVFSVLNALILRPINVPGGQNLYMIERGKGAPTQSYPDYLDIRDQNRTFDGVMAYDIAPAGLDTGGSASSVWVYEASGNYFDVLGVKPYLGRFFHSSDEHGPNSSPYIVLNYAYWQARFGGDRGAVGRTVQLNKYPYTILGVAPPDFRGTEMFYAPDFWVPLVQQEDVEGGSQLNRRSARAIELVGRLKTGVSAAQAATDLNSVAAYLAKTYPAEDDRINFKLARPGLFGDLLAGPVRAFLAALMVLAGLILLAVCANLGSLFAARAADRSKEIALRLALGSSARRVVRQLLTETLLVSLIGGAAGLLVGMVVLRWLSQWRPVPDFPVNVPVNPDSTVYAIALLLALASGFLFGLAPMRQVMRADAYQIIKSGTTGSAGRRIALRDMLLVVQVAICAVLLTASLVAVRGLVRSLHGDFGFSPQNVTLVETYLDMAGYKGDAARAMQRQMIEAAEAIPGATAAGVSDRVPLGIGWNTDEIFRDDSTDTRASHEVADALKYSVTPGYFEAAGTSLLAGRTFTWNDDKNAPRVAVVNREFAREVFGTGEDAVGRYFRNNGGRMQVVGLVENGKYETLAENPRPAMFCPMLQSPSSATWLLVRSDRDSQDVAEALRSMLRRLDAGLPYTVRTWNAEMASALFASRAATVSLGVLGVLSAMLAVTGISGMASYSVSKRLREFGIRIALGAQRKEVLSAALGRAFWLLAWGSAGGVLLGTAATRVLALIVYQASPRDPLVLAGVVMAMAALGLLATWIPARRALKADPLILLREE
jgi:predicted permease